TISSRRRRSRSSSCSESPRLRSARCADLLVSELLFAAMQMSAWHEADIPRRGPVLQEAGAFLFLHAILRCVSPLLARSGHSRRVDQRPVWEGLCCKSLFGIWSRNIDSRSGTNEQQRFKRTDAPIRLLQISISQSLLGDFCNTIGGKADIGYVTDDVRS